MLSIRDFVDSGGRMLARRLAQLCDTLENLGSRLRGTLANVIGETIGFIVRDAALRILDEVTHCLPASDSLSSPLRGDKHEMLARQQDGDEYGYWDDEDDVCFEVVPEGHPTSVRPARLSGSLSAGLQAASWWLRRWTGRKRVITTLAVGLIATTVAFFGGPLVIAVLGLAHAATHFTSTSGVIETSDVDTSE